MPLVHNLGLHHVFEDTLHPLLQDRVVGDEPGHVVAVELAELGHLLLVGEVDRREVHRVVRIGQHHRQGEEAEDQTDGESDAEVFNEVVEGIAEVLVTVIVDDLVQGCVILLQNFRLRSNKMRVILVLSSE